MLSDKEIFDALRVLHGGRLTQTQVDDYNVQIKQNRDSVLKLLEEKKPQAVLVSRHAIKAAYSVALEESAIYINRHAAKYGINNKKRLAAFIGTCFVESFGFRTLEENLNYKSATRLMAVYGKKRIPSVILANKLVAGGPRAIANHVYGDRNGNRGRNTDDGWNYRGRGAIQITGLANYRAVAKSTGLDIVNKPELLKELEPAIITSMDWWKQNGCNELADKLVFDFTGTNLRKSSPTNYSSSTTLVNLRRRVNGGVHGLADLGIFIERLMKEL